MVAPNNPARDVIKILCVVLIPLAVIESFRDNRIISDLTRGHYEVEDARAGALWRRLAVCLLGLQGAGAILLLCQSSRTVAWVRLIVFAAMLPLSAAATAMTYHHLHDDTYDSVFGWHPYRFILLNGRVSYGL